MERVLKEVTDNNKINENEEAKHKSRDETSNEETDIVRTTPVMNRNSSGQKPRKGPVAVLSPLLRSREKPSPSHSSPSQYSPALSPVNVVIQRSGERNVVNPRNIVMVRHESESSVRSENSFNQSLNMSSMTPSDSLNSSLLNYDTPDLIKYQKMPRVDLPKLRLPPSMFVGTEESGDDSNEDDAVRDEPDNNNSSVKSPRRGQTEVEDELVMYQIKCLEEAEKRVEERRVNWENKSKEKEEELKSKLEEETKKFKETSNKKTDIEIVDLEKRIEETLVLQQIEREKKQKDLILLAKQEEQLAKEKQERKARIKQQMEKYVPQQETMKVSIKSLLDLWSSVQDKNLMSPELASSIPLLLKHCQDMLNEARIKVAEGDCDDSMIQNLVNLDTQVNDSLKKLQDDILRIDSEKNKLLEQQQEEAKKKAAEEEALKQQQLQQQSLQPQQQAAAAVQQQAAAAVQQQATPPSAAATPAPAVVSTPGVVLDSISAENKAWYDSIIQFKADFIKDVSWADNEKTFKFELQKGVNTPLNSLSGVNSAHLQDKVDKLVQLLSGGQVTIGDKTVSIQGNEKARRFCLGLAAKKLSKQGEDVVSSDHKSAFPAATFALAIWDKFPEFGQLLLAYMFESCPFLVPYHPVQVSGQTDKQYYESLGYKYDGDTIEKQDKYLKRMSGLARLYAALSVSHLPKTSASTSHPHPPARLWSWVSSVLNLTPHTDITATLILDILEVAGNTLYTKYGKQFAKLLVVTKEKYFSKLESVKSEGGPTVRLEQQLSMAIRGQSIKEPDGYLKPGFL